MSSAPYQPVSGARRAAIRPRAMRSVAKAVGQAWIISCVQKVAPIIEDAPAPSGRAADVVLFRRAAARIKIAMPKPQKTLFDTQRDETLQRQAPLAARMRPRTLDGFVGQEQVVGEGRLLRRAILSDTLFSIILWGPPGSGKTTLARIVAETTNAHFEPLSAVSAGVADLRRVVKEAQDRLG